MECRADRFHCHAVNPQRGSRFRTDIAILIGGGNQFFRQISIDLQSYHAGDG